MFQIGAFSRIAQVSASQLRNYDQLGLFAPEKVDPQTGYRYYSARCCRCQTRRGRSCKRGCETATRTSK